MLSNTSRYPRTKVFILSFYFLLTQTNISVLLASDDEQSQVNITTLKQIQIIFRHGISVPNKDISYPLDIYKMDSSWPAPRGNLITDGEYYQKELGKFIRRRYNGFLSENYIEDELYILSSDATSAQDSLRATLQGMYPQYENPVSEKGYYAFDNTLWEINSVYTIPSLEDNILKMSKSCKKWDQLYKVAKEKAMNANATEESETISRYSKYIAKNSGLNGNDLDSILQLHTVLTAQTFCNMSLPAWTRPLLHSKTFMSLVKLSYEISTYSEEMKRLKSGPLLKTITNNIYQSTENAEDKNMHKIFLYSGHAETVANLWNTLSSLGINFPQYTGAIIIELHETSNEHSIYIFYRNEMNGTNTHIPIKGGDTNSSFYNLEEFRTFVEQYITDDNDEECKPNDQDLDFPTKELVTAICLLAAFPILVFIFVKLLYIHRKNEEFSPLLNTHKVF